MYLRMKKVTIEIEVSEAGELLASWKRNLAAVEAQAATLKQRIGDMEAKLVAASEIPDVPTNEPNARAPRGQNIAMVSAFLKANPGKSAVDVSKEAGIALSSVMAVLNRRKDLFEKQRGLWSMK